jgi:hypothetical protein
MNSLSRDPLLAAAKVIVTIAQVLAVIGVVVLFIGLGAMLTVARSSLLAEMATAGVPGHAIWLIVLAMLIGAGLLMLAHRFFRELGGIIGSVGEGDPFRPENATRLSRMGWISVAAQLLILPIAAVAVWFAPYADKVDGHVKFDGGLDGGSILLTLILFILARVFREGTRMREELEGTV